MKTPTARMDPGRGPEAALSKSNIYLGHSKPALCQPPQGNKKLQPRNIIS